MVITTKKISRDQVKDLRSEISSIISYSYTSLGKLLEREVQEGDTLTAATVDGDVVSFFISRDLNYRHREFDRVVYLGLSGTNRRYTRTGMRTACVERRFIELRENTLGRVLGIASTAFSGSYIVAEKLATRISPTRDGCLNLGDRQIFENLIQLLAGRTAQEGDPVFVIRNVTDAIYRTSPNLTASEISLINNNAIRPEEGDRIYFLCELGEPSRFGAAQSYRTAP